MQKDKKLILVLDMLNGFTKTGALASKYVNNLIPKIVNYLEKEKTADNIFLCDSHNEDDLEMKIYPLHCLKNSFESEIVEELKPYAKKIILKQTTNSFFILDLEEIKQYQTIEIIGCCTDICILELALTLKIYLDKIKINKPIIVYENLVDTFNTKKHNRKKFHSFSLKLMKNAGVIIKKYK